VNVRVATIFSPFVQVFNVQLYHNVEKKTKNRPTTILNNTFFFHTNSHVEFKIDWVVKKLACVKLSAMYIIEICRARILFHWKVKESAKT